MEASDSVKEELNKLYRDERRKHMERRKRQWADQLIYDHIL